MSERRVQKLELSRGGIYKDAKISGFGERRVDFSGSGKKIDNQYAKHREVVCVGLEICSGKPGIN